MQAGIYDAIAKPLLSDELEMPSMILLAEALCKPLQPFTGVAASFFPNQVRSARAVTSLRTPSTAAFLPLSCHYSQLLPLSAQLGKLLLASTMSVCTSSMRLLCCFCLLTCTCRTTPSPFSLTSPHLYLYIHLLTSALLHVTAQLFLSYLPLQLK